MASRLIYVHLTMYACCDRHMAYDLLQIVLTIV